MNDVSDAESGSGQARFSPGERLLTALERIPGLNRGVAQLLLLAALFAVSQSLYLVVLKWRGPAAVYQTQTEWDRAIPFEPAWIWLYLLPFAVGPLIAALLRRAVFIWYFDRALWVIVLTQSFFVLVPTQTVRPAIDHLEDNLTNRLYKTIATIDTPPANAAPSLHVSLSCLLAWALAYDRPRLSVVALVLASIVWMSTLFTWQHHLIDVISGILVASIAALRPPRKSESRI